MRSLAIVLEGLVCKRVPVKSLSVKSIRKIYE